jgi:DNA polymerase III sliding clamp (beta) subunit (PCNA family)
MNIVQAVNTVGPCISDGDMVKVLSHICLSDNKVMAYNGVQGMVVVTEGIEDLSCAVPGVSLVKLLNSLPSEGIVLTQSQGSLEISCKKTRTKARLASVKRKDFIFKEDTLFDLKGILITVDEAFLNGLVKCGSTVNKDDAKLSQTGITLSVDKTGSNMYSTDGKQLSRYALVTKSKDYFKIMLPKKFCDLLLSNKTQFLSKKLLIGTDNVMIHTDNMWLFSHTIPDLSFMPYEKSIASNVSDNMKMFNVTDKLKEAVDRCMIVMPSNEKSIKIVVSGIEGNVVELTGVSSMGRVIERVKINKSFESCEMFVNGEHLKEVLNSTNKLTFNITDRKRTVIVGMSDCYTRLLTTYVAIEPPKEDSEEEE